MQVICKPNARMTDTGSPYISGMKIACYIFAIPLFLSTALADERVGTAAYGDWHTDAPGVLRHLTVDSLPAPNAAASASHSPTVVSQPAGVVLHVPPGFSVEQVASGLRTPRTLRVAPNGDVFVAESGDDRVRVLRLINGKVAANAVFADGADLPYGIAFWPPGSQPQYVYIAETGRVVRYPYKVGELKPHGPSETIVSRLPTGGHWTRDLVFSRDGQTMFVSVGSYRNVTPFWDVWETDRADVLAFDPDGGHRRIFASGLRNCSGEVLSPSGDLWCVVNERDGLGDNLPPDYAAFVHESAFYGWPWFYIGAHRDPRMTERSELAKHVAIPDVLIQPHSAPLGITFYNGAQFPAEYRGDAFVTLHGSWNRAHPTGFKVIRLRFKDGRPTGAYEDFLTGFVISDDAVWGRPVGIAVANDGSLLMSEDGNGTIWRIAWKGE
jgi:glucose/arabinose dehydrogenase